MSHGEFHGSGDHHSMGSAMMDDDATPQSDVFCTGNMGMVMYVSSMKREAGQPWKEVVELYFIAS